MNTPFSAYATELTYWLLVQSPLILVWLAGGVLAIIFWKRHPTVSLLLLAAMIISLGAMLLDGYSRVWLVHDLIRRDIGSPVVDGWRGVFSLTTWMRSVQFLIAAMYAVAWGLTLGAVFGWRVAAPARKPVEAETEAPVTVQPAH